MTAWLAPVRDALDAAAQPIRYFFRNDDVGRADDRLFPLLDLFAERGVAVDLAVIPAALGDDMARRLADRLAASDGRVRAHQHGWRHANHEIEGRQCEFGAARGSAEQAVDLKAGRARLRAALGAFVDPIFTPPWNRCGQGTADLLAAGAYRVLSRDAGAAPLRLGGLAELPVSVDWQKGVRHEAGPEGVGHAIAQAAAAANGLPVGIMLHHSEMDDRQRACLGALLDLLAGHGNARCVTMMDCVNGRSEAS